MKKSIFSLLALCALFGFSALAHAEDAKPQFQFTHDLSVGAMNDDVRQLQMLLNMDADTTIASSGNGSSGHEVSNFGMLTRKAVQAFQKKNHLNPSGFVGPLTRKLLNELFAKKGGLGVATSDQVVATAAPISAGTRAETLRGELASGTIAINNVTGLSFIYREGTTGEFPYVAKIDPVNTTASSFATTLSGLKSSSTYSYEACVTAGQTSSCGKPYMFKTPPAIPLGCSIEGLYADQIVNNTATIHWLTSGCDSLTLSSDTSSQSVSKNSSLAITLSSKPVSYTLTGTSPFNTMAQYLIIDPAMAKNTSSTFPVVSGILASLGTKGKATVSMIYAGGGEAPSIWFGYGASASSISRTSSPVTGDPVGGFASVPLDSLGSGSDYYFQAYAKNSVGTASSPVIKLTIPNL